MVEKIGGENVLPDDRSGIDQGIGEKVLQKGIIGGDNMIHLVEETPEEQPEGEKKEGPEVLSGEPEVAQGETAGEKVMDPEIKGKFDHVKEMVDQYGNHINPDSIERLRELAINDPEKFHVEADALTREMLRWGFGEGYKAAQVDIGKALRGKTPQVTAKILRGKIGGLKEDMANIKDKFANGTYQSKRAKKFARKQLGRDEAMLSQAVFDHNLVSNLQKQDKMTPVAPRNPDEILRSSEEDNRGERSRKSEEISPLNVEDPQYGTMKKVRRWALEQAARFIPEGMSDYLLGKLDNVEALEQKMIEDLGNGFAGVSENSGPVTEEEIARAANLAAGQNEHNQQGGSVAQVRQRTQQEQDIEYRQGMKNLLDEAKANPGRFDKYDEELMRMQDEEKRMKELEEQKSSEGRLDRVFGKLRGRVLRHKTKQVEQGPEQNQNGEPEPAQPEVGQDQDAGNSVLENGQGDGEGEKKPEVDLGAFEEILKRINGKQ